MYPNDKLGVSYVVSECVVLTFVWHVCLPFTNIDNIGQ